MAVTLDTIDNKCYSRHSIITYLGSDSTEREKVCGNNTKVFTYREEQDRLTAVMRLHNTNIIKFCPDGRIILNSGGWQTVTTKDRMNRVLGSHGYNVFQKDYVWYVWDRYNDETVEYYDGMVLEERY